MPSLAICVLAEDLDLQAQRFQALDPGGEFFRMQDVGRLGDQVAAEQDGVGDGLQAGEGLPGLGRIGGGDLDHATEGFFSAFSVVRYLSKR
jgi:hypothetical protein